MPKEVYIPKLGQTVEEVTIVEWVIEDKSEVAPGDEILQVETDKALFPIEANARGVLHIGPYKKGAVVPVLTVVAIIGSPEDVFPDGTRSDDTPTRADDDAGNKAIQPQQGSSAGDKAGPSPEPAAPSRGISTPASPRARMRASKRGIDLSQVTPTGNRGQRIVESDVLALAADEYASTSPIIGTHSIKRIPLSGIRAITASRMLESAQSTARVTLIMEVDASRLVAFRSALVTEHADEWGFKPGYTPILAMLVSRALKRAPFMNARWVENRIEQHESVNMGIAMDTDRGLVVPVIRAIDRMGLRSICEEFIQQVAAVRQNTIAPDALQGGTFTLTNLGGYEVDAFTPIINPPETAILGIGRIAERPFVVNHQLTARHTMTLSLAFDHRLVDGAPAARFLQKIKQYTEEPGLLITL